MGGKDQRVIELDNYDDDSLFLGGRRLETRKTEKSNECKFCIDEENRWCPTSTYDSGYCCSANDFQNCPRASMCSDEFSKKEL